MIERSIEHSYGMLTLEQIKSMIVDGQAFVFATMRNDRFELALVVNIVQYGTYKAARIIACSGRGLKEALRFLSVLENWAFFEGCLELEGWCRPAMVKLTKRLGWSPKVSIVTRDLRRKLQ